jgi:archaellum component FlaD/FlaE
VEPTADIDGESSSRDEVEDAEVEFVEDTLAGSTKGSAKPYLDRVPDGYVGDVQVMEWLRYLVEASDPVDARRALEYYVAIEWIDAATADSLIAFLRGFGPIDDGDDEGTETDERPVGPRTLTMRHHTHSLRYICHLASDTPASIVFKGGSMPPPDGGEFETEDR